LPQEGVSGFVDGEHYFDTIADDALFEFHYNFPGWPQAARGRANLARRMDQETEVSRSAWTQ
jgi:hypothetical protein